MVQRKKCRARKTLKNYALDTKIGVDTAENEPYKVCLIFSKNHLTLERIGAQCRFSNNLSLYRLGLSLTRADQEVDSKRLPINVLKGTFVLSKCFLRTWVHHFDLQVCYSNYQSRRQLLMQEQDYADANIFLFSFTFLLFVFLDFHFRFAFSYMGNDILRGPPFITLGIQLLDRCRVDLPYFSSQGFFALGSSV